MTENKIYLYVGNHSTLEGIEDYLSILRAIFEKRGIPLEATTSLYPDAINLIIDEFSSHLERKNLSIFKTVNPNAKYIVLLTEFTTSRWGLKSFNHFGGLIESCLIAGYNLFDTFVRGRHRISLSELMISIAYFPVLFLYVASFMALASVKYLLAALSGKRSAHPIAQFHNQQHRIWGFHARYLGISEGIKLADGLVAIHEGIFRQLIHCGFSDLLKEKVCGVLHAEFEVAGVIEKLRMQKALCIEVTGSITKYRRDWISSVDNDVINSGIKGFGFCEMKSFSDASKEIIQSRNAYSLHPPQQARWGFSSPTRIYRALVVDGNIPVITAQYDQNAIEKICIKYEGVKTIRLLGRLHKDTQEMINFMKPRLDEYEKHAEIENAEVIKRIFHFV